MSKTDWERKALELWKLLDDIDTLDDACRGDDKAFRDAARRVQRKRFDIIDGSEFDLRIPDYPDLVAKL